MSMGTALRRKSTNGVLRCCSPLRAGSLRAPSLIALEENIDLNVNSPCSRLEPCEHQHTVNAPPRPRTRQGTGTSADGDCPAAKVNEGRAPLLFDALPTSDLICATRARPLNPQHWSLLVPFAMVLARVRVQMRVSVGAVRDDNL